MSFNKPLLKRMKIEIEEDYFEQLQFKRIRTDNEYKIKSNEEYIKLLKKIKQMKIKKKFR